MTGAIPKFMSGVHLIGHGDFGQLRFRTDIETPHPAGGEVLIRVGAAGVNNTDINTRTGWYSRSVRGATGEGSDDAVGWLGEALQFPRIQGADCCGRIVAVGDGVDTARIGERVLVRPMQGRAKFSCATFGSEMDGGFAQFAKADSAQALPIDCDWTDVELASIPCAYSTAEGMLCRAGVGADRVLVTGASGGVGSAAVQLAKRRGAEVIGIAARPKAADVLALGADQVIGRGESLIDSLGTSSVDVVVDLVGGPQWPEIPEILENGGRYVTSGAIAGPIVELDLRTLYLKDLTFFGSTYQGDEIFENLITYIERNEIRSVVAKTYELENIVEAQQDFLSKTFTGKLVLIPPPD